MENVSAALNSSGVRGVALRNLFVLLVVVVLVWFVWIFNPVIFNPGSAILLLRSIHDVAIPLPSNCIRTAEINSDEMTAYLEGERRQRGLVFKNWIVCQPPDQVTAQALTFAHDPQWLPMYVPSAYQFRRIVVITNPNSLSIPNKTSVVAEVCLIPWQRYISQVGGERGEKFAVWK